MTQGIHEITTGKVIENVEDLPVDNEAAAAAYIASFAKNTSK
jgi:hypothetical protein